MKLSGKTALVTGASRGIGRAIAQNLSGLGADVLINYAGNDYQAEITRELCIKNGVNAKIFKADVGNMSECGEMFKFAECAFGHIDIMVNNAGITRDNLLMRMTEHEYDEVMQVNLKGAFNCTKLAVRPMIKKRAGRIINISSVVGLMGNAGQVNYAASKAGLIGMTKAAARELAARGITVNAIAPGFIETDMTDALSSEAKQVMLSQIPQGRFGSGEDIAAAVAFLCGDDAGYITGQVISVNGGMIMD